MLELIRWITPSSATLDTIVIICRALVRSEIELAPGNLEVCYIG
jgi:hypothetical protein